MAFGLLLVVIGLLLLLDSLNLIEGVGFEELWPVLLIVIGVATFSFAFASFYYYAASLDGVVDDARRRQDSGRADRLWLLGCVSLFLAPSLTLFAIGLLAVALPWFVLWLAYVLFAILNFPRVRADRKS